MRRRSLIVFAMAGVFASGTLQAQKKRKEAPPAAVVAGSVFREGGFSLPGASVLIEPDNEGSEKQKPYRTQTDARGEFAVRVPTVPLRYTVSVQKAGFGKQEKKAEVTGEGRYELTFLLEPR